MTPKDIFLTMLQGERPPRLLDQYEALCLWPADPINRFLRSGESTDGLRVDKWGVTISKKPEDPGPVPVTTDELKVIKDITRWRDYVKAPDIEAECTEGWEECRLAGRAAAGDDRLFCAFTGTGVFEECHFLMGFGDTLTNLYEHPEEMHQLIDYITEYKLKVVKMLIDELQPDAVFFHDDWGTKSALFMSPQMWRDFLKEPYRRIYVYIRSRGVIAIHHADSYMTDIAEDMAEIGIQCWQGVLPENDIPGMQQRLRGKMLLMGGISGDIDRPDSTEEEIRAHVRANIERFAPGGGFIPSITYGLAGSIYPHVDPIIGEEIARYNAGLHIQKSIKPPVQRLAKAQAGPAQTGSSADAEKDILQAMADALYKGQKKKLSELADRALAQDIQPKDILEKGLIAGMDRLGEDFSAGIVFVPEMLVAAKCMKAVMEKLDPLLKASGAQPAGRAVVGTVKGDLHDIGKNLVKIMLEGAGAEVIDIGVDNSAEDFLDAAAKHGCTIVACSSLLTTAMWEMERVVKLAEERGVRKDLTILVGGAPVTQEFCDRIGADYYTEDAAQAARLVADLAKDRL